MSNALRKGLSLSDIKANLSKKVGTQAREEMEQFFGKKVFLEQFIKVEPDWRQKAQKLKQFGYSQD